MLLYIVLFIFFKLGNYTVLVSFRFEEQIMNTKSQKQRESVAQSVFAVESPAFSTTERGQHMVWAMRSLPSSKRYGFGTLL